MTQRAPPRGRYDRSVTPSQRAHDQRELILEAAEQLLLQQTAPTVELTVSELCQHTGLGRNTVYSQFATANQITQQVIANAITTLSPRPAAPEVPQTPIDAIRTFARSWIERAAARPTGTRLALRWGREELEGRLERDLSALLERGAAAGAFAPDAEHRRAALLAAAALTAARLASDTPAQAAPLASLLADTLIKAAR